jgi:hypothetical protein
VAAGLIPPISAGSIGGGRRRKAALSGGSAARRRHPSRPPSTWERPDAAKLATALRFKEAEHLERLAQEGRQVLGAEAVLAQDPYGRPDNCEPRRELNPKVACRDKWRRIEALRRMQVFLEAYRAAWELFKAGLRNVTWPWGAYWFPRIAGCPCAGPG